VSVNSGKGTAKPSAASAKSPALRSGCCCVAPPNFHHTSAAKMPATAPAATTMLDCFNASRAIVARFNKGTVEYGDIPRASLSGRRAP
jgi:hypothetical protein